MAEQWIIRGEVILLTLFCAIVANAQKRWTYTFKSFDGETSSTDLFTFDLKVARLGRSDFAIAGTFDLNYEMPQDETTVEITSYRSLTGNSDYKPLPFSIKKQNIVSFMNGPYKEMIMENFKECSDLPYFEDEFQPPFAAGHYEFRNCQVDTKDMPDDLPAGFYKIIVHVVGGDLEFSIIGVAKIESAL